MRDRTDSYGTLFANLIIQPTQILQELLIIVVKAAGLLSPIQWLICVNEFQWAYFLLDLQSLVLPL